MKTHSEIKVFKSGEYEYIYIYFKLGPNMLRIPTNQKVVKGKMTKNLLFSSKVEDHERKNKELTGLKLKVDSYIQVKLREHFPTINQKECKKFIQEYYMRGDLFSGKKYQPLPESDPEEKPLISYFEKYIQFRKDRNTNKNTLKEFTTVKNRLTNFDNNRNKTTYLKDLNITWSDEFEKFLINQKYMLGTIEKTYTILKTVLYHFYERKDEMKLDMSDKFLGKHFKRGEKSRNKAKALNLEQFKTLFNHNFDEEHLELTRLRFCLQCSTGVRFGDLHRINKENIKGDRIHLVPQKTKRYNKKAIIDLNYYSRKIIEKLNYDTSTLKIENAPYNRNLKEIFKKMQTEYPNMNFLDDYGTHNGRDTFISIAVQKGVDFKTILTWTGQSSYSVMDRYIETTDDYKAGQMQKAFPK